MVTFYENENFSLLLGVENISKMLHFRKRCINITCYSMACCTNKQGTEPNQCLQVSKETRCNIGGKT